MAGSVLHILKLGTTEQNISYLKLCLGVAFHATFITYFLGINMGIILGGEPKNVEYCTRSGSVVKSGGSYFAEYTPVLEKKYPE